VYAEPPYDEKWSHQDAFAYLERFMGFDPENCFVAIGEHGIEGALFGFAYPWQGSRLFYLQELFVKTECRGTGIGRALMYQLAKESGGASVWLVANQNAPAVGFYDKMGLRPHPFYKFFSGRIRSHLEKHLTG